ncbi:MAG: helix-turn-helix domain-containing protein [Acidobacteriota bacterium]
MPKLKQETLAEYVTRIISEKNLKQHEVKEISGGEITDGYVRGIMTGKARNPSVDKLKALARGLGVSEDEIFKVARGLPFEGEHREQQSNYRVIVNLMSASLKNSALTELLAEAARLSLDSQEEGVRLLRYLNSRKSKSSRSKKKA